MIRTHVIWGADFPIYVMPPQSDDQTLGVDDEAFVQVIRSIVEPDPHFESVDTAKNLLYELLIFLKDYEGKPNVHIPEIAIGNTILRNISCIELVCRIYRYDVEGIHAVWDNSGVEINQLFNATIKAYLSSIDEMIDDPSLGVDNIIPMIRLVHECDPYLYYGKITGNRILQLMDKFLENKGDPLSIVSNVKIGNERLDDLTIYELVSNCKNKWSYLHPDLPCEQSAEHGQQLAI